MTICVMPYQEADDLSRMSSAPFQFWKFLLKDDGESWRLIKTVITYQTMSLFLHLSSHVLSKADGDSNSLSQGWHLITCHRHFFQLNPILYLRLTMKLITYQSTDDLLGMSPATFLFYLFQISTLLLPSLLVLLHLRFYCKIKDKTIKNDKKLLKILQLFSVKSLKCVSICSHINTLNLK